GDVHEGRLRDVDALVVLGLVRQRVFALLAENIRRLDVGGAVVLERRALPCRPRLQLFAIALQRVVGFVVFERDARIAARRRLGRIGDRFEVLQLEIIIEGLGRRRAGGRSREYLVPVL